MIFGTKILTMGNMLSANSVRGMFTRAANPVQLVYDTLRDHPVELQRCIEGDIDGSKKLLKACLDCMKHVSLGDLGIGISQLEKVKQNFCQTVYTCDEFHIAAFFVAPGCTLPLHDHPRMTVLSRVMHGSMMVRSYSPLRTSSQRDSANVIAVTNVLNELKTEQSDPWMLSPTNGNIHEFIGQSKVCGVFEVLIPPYKEGLRSCSYFAREASQEMLHRNGHNDDSTTQHLLLRKIPEPQLGVPVLVDYQGYEIKS